MSHYELIKRHEKQKKELIGKIIQSIKRIEDAHIYSVVNNDIDIFGDTIQKELENWEEQKK